MNDSFTRDELRQGIEALRIITELGRQDDLDFIVRKAADTCAASGADALTLGENLSAQALADHLARRIGVSCDRCLQAAFDVFGVNRDRRVLAAIIAYANELQGKRSGDDPYHLLKVYEEYGLGAMIAPSRFAGEDEEQERLAGRRNGVGASTPAAPTIETEIIPPKKRRGA